jgi:hypothetical protein
MANQWPINAGEASMFRISKIGKNKGAPALRQGHHSGAYSIEGSSNGNQWVINGNQ